MDDASRALDALSLRDHFTGPDDRVFPGERGSPVSEDAFRAALYAAMEAAGIDRRAFPARQGFTFHDLRHTFGTLAVRVFPLVDVQAYMGHADIQTTMRYAHHIQSATPPASSPRRFERREMRRCRNARLGSRLVNPMSADEIKHFLVMYDTAAKQVEVEDCGADYEAAQDACATAESDHDPDKWDVVLLSADSLETIKTTHSSYFDVDREAQRLKAKLPG